MKLNDRQKKLAAVGVGGLLFLVFMLARSRNAANTAATSDPLSTDTTIPTATGGGAGQSDFGGAGTTSGVGAPDLTGALSDISTGLDTLGSNQSVLYDTVSGLSAGQAAQQTSIDQLAGNLSSLSDQLPATAGIPGPAADPGQPAVAALAAPAAAVAAVKPKTVVKNGRVYHFYDTDPKKAGAERKVFVRPASTPKRSPSHAPKATPKAPPRTTRKVGHPAATHPKPAAKPAKPKSKRR